MMAEPTHNTRTGREKAVQVLFESTGCPALFLAKAAVLAAFAVGKQTALVLDAGHRGTTGGGGGWRPGRPMRGARRAAARMGFEPPSYVPDGARHHAGRLWRHYAAYRACAFLPSFFPSPLCAVAAVHEGYVLNKSVARSPIGGALLTAATLKVLQREAEAKGTKVMARHMFKRAGGEVRLMLLLRSALPGRETAAGAAALVGLVGGAAMPGLADAPGSSPLPLGRGPAPTQVKPESNPKITASYDEWAVNQVAEDALEMLVRASDTAFDESEAGSAPAQVYEVSQGRRRRGGASAAEEHISASAKRQGPRPCAAPHLHAGQGLRGPLPSAAKPPPPGPTPPPTRAAARRHAAQHRRGPLAGGRAALRLGEAAAVLGNGARRSHESAPCRPSRGKRPAPAPPPLQRAQDRCSRSPFATSAAPRARPPSHQPTNPLTRLEPFPSVRCVLHSGPLKRPACVRTRPPAVDK
jgi:hypothetical protein